jgi:hypothetical protein
MNNSLSIQQNGPHNAFREKQLPGPVKRLRINQLGQKAQFSVIAGNEIAKSTLAPQTVNLRLGL